MTPFEPTDFAVSGGSITAKKAGAIMPKGDTDPSRQAMWHAFLKKNQLAVTPLLEVVTTLRTRLEPALIQAATFAAAADLVEVDKQDSS